MNQDSLTTKFHPGDHVEIIGGIPGVWKIHSRIVTPPPRWEPQGDTKISYHLIYHHKGPCRIVDEEQLRPA